MDCDGFHKACAANGAIGAAVARIDSGRVEYCCYGKKSRYGTEAISVDTCFEIGSITKVFTTAMLAHLVLTREIDLDAPCTYLLPQSVIMPSFQGEQITFRHLSTHYSGLPNLPTNLRPRNLANPYKDFSIEKLYQFLNECTLARLPGERFEYSNLGVGLLGHLLCLKTRKQYSALLAEILLRPLTMHSTGDAKMLNRMSEGHLLGCRTPSWQATEAMSGAIGLCTDIRDMAKFVLAHLGYASDALVISLRKCHEKQAPSGLNEHIGLGWIISSMNGEEVLWHDGITAGSRAFIGFHLKKNRGIAILANSTQDWLDRFALDVLCQ